MLHGSFILIVLAVMTCTYLQLVSTNIVSVPDVYFDEYTKPPNNESGAYHAWKDTPLRISHVERGGGGDGTDIPFRPFVHPSPVERATKALNDYTDAHSERRLIDEHRRCEADKSDCAGLSGRRYAVGYFSCPYQAGNRLHHFMNALIWSALTNRTMLWKYYDAETCRKVGVNYDESICRKTGNLKICGQALKLAGWVPSYDKWKEQLGLPDPIDAPYWSTHVPPRNKGAVKVRRNTSATTRQVKTHARHPEWKAGDEESGGIDRSEQPLLHFGHLLGNDMAVLEIPKNQEYLLHTKHGRDMAEELITSGNKFLYGMVFHKLFSFADGVLPEDDTVEMGGNVTSIAIHSRHSDLHNNGSDVSVEMNCLKRILEETSTELPCHVYIMSDRPRSVSGMIRAVDELGCTPIVSLHKRDLSFRKEHGPYAGLGFFQDLALASKARNGLVGSKRSSTLLLDELIAYERIREAEQDLLTGQKPMPWARCSY